ncbi:hypothetical protein [Gloeobacter kilaueensis]|uniref:Uncharacterized protein n=1 Tax=Gloeobacter kilaueensis (strain ATCC BAA-2537 / CCAP 1431/1 / ULC 316 / JS1) TaxID=1183438 RepID=U5QJ00_GLOK1|nr:hypothetical protein [Gloeobacter kilaueensis]AGY58828.1 hypothetical protein GKIL_2582 [Gloeobacter kilaueensis JS1]
MGTLLVKRSNIGLGRYIECPRCGTLSWWLRMDGTLHGECPHCARRVLGSHHLQRGLWETYLIVDNSFLCPRGC